jgi:uncharacterized protein (TIGR03435 family)
MRLTVLLLLALVVFAQAPKRIEFEVASVRPVQLLDGVGARTPAASQMNDSNVRLAYLTFRDFVQRAYQVKAFQITGPEWTMTNRYDINATLPAGATTAQVPEMLRNLLTDRFGLKMHIAPKEFSVYRLTRGKRPFTPKESDPQAKEFDGLTVSGPRSGDGVQLNLPGGAIFTFAELKLDSKGMTMQQLANNLSNFLPLPVLDETGLTGHYDFRVDLIPEDYSMMMARAAANRGVSYPPQLLAQLDTMNPASLFAGLEKLGLTLEKGKASLDVIVIDDAKQMPSEN